MDSHKDEKASFTSDDGFDVYPLHLLDDTKLNAHLVTFTLIFNDVLDVDKIRTALEKLLQKGDWRKLGGRLKRTANGRLELHVPKQFTSEHPAVTFTHADHTTVNMADHEIGSKVPQATKLPSSQKLSAPVDLLPLGARKNHPKTVDELISQNLPVLSIHVTSFKDATCIGILNPHNLMDAASQLALIQCWSLVINGKEKYVPGVLGAKADVLDALDQSLDPKKKALFEQKRMRKLKKLIFILNFLLTRFRNPLTETRMMYLPKQSVAELQKEAEEGRAGQEISSNDLFVAWATKIIASARSSPKAVTMIHLLNARGRLPLVDSQKGVFIQNMVALAYTFLSKEQIANDSLGKMALENRQQLSKQVTEEELSLFLRKTRADSKAQKKPSLICGDNPLSSPILFNNLTSASPTKAGDFRTALLKQGDMSPTRTNLPGMAIFLLHQPVLGYVKLSESFYVFNKTLGGDYWLMATVSKRAWKKFDEELARLTKIMERDLASATTEKTEKTPTTTENVPATTEKTPTTTEN